jgi:tRNA(Ile)-lysidine synthase
VSTAETAPVSAAEAETLFADLAAAPALVLAVSGGPDSSALLVLAARWRDARASGPALVAVTVDHGLRPEAVREAEDVAHLAAALGVTHRMLHWTGKKPTGGLQAAARAARYRLLSDTARDVGAPFIVTAHTRDDQAETVLMRLVRGSGPTGLCAMGRTTPLGDLALVRPLIDIPKQRLIATLDAEHIGFADDPSNRDPRFTRARLRALMPMLAQEGLDADRLIVLAQRLRRSEAAIEAIVDLAAERVAPVDWHVERRIALDAAGLRSLPAEVRLRLIGRAIARAGDEGPIELRKLEDLVMALDPALRQGSPARFRRTLGGAMVTLGTQHVTVERAPPRARRRPRPMGPSAKP